MQLDVINTPIVVTALIAGLISMVILLYPIVAYSKEFNRINQTGKSYMEIFAKVFGIQFSLLLFITAFAFLLNISVGTKGPQANYSIKYGTALFYGYFDPSSGSFTEPVVENGSGFWTIWEKLSDKGLNVYNSLKNNTTSAGQTKVVAASLVIINMMTTVIWIALFLYPPFCLLLPVFMMMRQSQQGRSWSYVEKAWYCIVFIVGMVLLGWIHSKIASLFVVLQLDNNSIDFWKQMQSIWTGIFKN